jgi:hypothetical protein
MLVDAVLKASGSNANRYGEHHSEFLLIFVPLELRRDVPRL